MKAFITCALLALLAPTAAAQPGLPAIGSAFEVTSPTAPTGIHAGVVQFTTGSVNADGEQVGQCEYTDYRTGQKTTMTYQSWKDGGGAIHMWIYQGEAAHFFTWRPSAGYWRGWARYGPPHAWDVPDAPLPPSIRDLLPLTS